jgi:hypothetical protein
MQPQQQWCVMEAIMALVIASRRPGLLRAIEQASRQTTRYRDGAIKQNEQRTASGASGS